MSTIEASIDFIANRFEGWKGVRLLGAFGSAARGSKTPRDIDLFMVFDGNSEGVRVVKDALKSLEIDVNAIIVSPNEMGSLPAVFKYSLLQDFVVIKGDNSIVNDLRVDVREVLRELELDIQDNYLAAMRMRGKADNVIISTRVFRALRALLWMIFVKEGLSLPNNVNEMVKQLEKLQMKKMIEALKREIMNSPLTLINNELDIIRGDVDLSTAINIIRRFSHMASSLHKARGFINLVKERLSEIIEEKDIRKIREACQDLFLAIYEAARIYFYSKGIVFPETHKEIMEQLRERANYDPAARILSPIYNEAFEELHINCHYRGLGDQKILEKWIAKVSEALNQFEPLI